MSSYNAKHEHSIQRNQLAMKHKTK